MSERRPRTVITIQARMRSERLPGKVLAPVAGRPLLELMVERLRRVRLADDIVIATTMDSSCDGIAQLASQIGVGCFRGSEEDVLDRVLLASREARAELIVETTGDCPLLDPATVDRVIGAFLSSDVDYCSNTLRRTYPRGMDVQVFPLRVLDEVARSTSDPVDREHVSLYIYEHPERFRLMNIESGLSPGAEDIRLTVDTPQDLQLVRQVFERLLPRRRDFDLADIMALLRQHPELLAINASVRQKTVRA